MLDDNVCILEKSVGLQTMNNLYVITEASFQNSI